ncbi:MAG: cytochrome c oxidase subunit I [Micromonosporaceae bacterium]
MTAGTHRAQAQPATARPSALEWLLTTDHKRIGLLTLGTAFLLFLLAGALALVMRAQLAQPGGHVVSPGFYNEIFTMHGSTMIYLVVTPFAMGLGVYLVPLQVGAPAIAAPRATLLGFWLYVAGSVALIWSFMLGGAQAGWFAYTPLSDGQYSPNIGNPLWIAGVFLSASGMILLGGTVLWTALCLRAPGITMMRLPVFTWSMIVTCLMVLMSFPALLTAMGMLAYGRIHPGLFHSNAWNIGYQYVFWFYGHPVVYVMFFPFVGCVAEVLATFSGRRFFGYTGTVFALLAFSALSMAVWGHHMFTTGQAVNDYYSLTSILLSVPAGVEYLGFVGTIIGGRLRYSTPMLFALAFLPQFLIGGLTGIMIATPTIDYHVEDSYFIVAHFHYTLFAGSVFGFFAGLYFWFPKATGVMFSERLGRLHFLLMVIGTNVTFLPMFGLGFLGLPRRMVSYPANAGFTTLSLISSVGAFILGLAVLVFVHNIYLSALRKVPAPQDPWQGQTLEWATSSPPPPYNFSEEFPVPRVRSHAPLLDLWEQGVASPPDRARR